MERFRVIRSVGKGSFGLALLVQRKSDGQQFVIKQINTTRMSRKERAEVENEVAVLSRLRSPNIVAYVESFHHRGALCIVMEYADGGDLEKTLQKRRGRLLPEDMVLDWFIQICLALKYVHNRKILHRDLKPANIMLSTSGSGPPVVKLGDFGIAKVLSNTMELARTAIGTPYYLSPEICREERYNNKSDIWSLGCILYEMCSLKHAFEGRNMKQLVQSIMKGRVAPLPRGFSSGVSELVGACLHRDPRRRPRVDRILQHPLLQKRIDAHIGDDAARAELAHTAADRAARRAAGERVDAGPSVEVAVGRLPRPTLDDRAHDRDGRRRHSVDPSPSAAAPSSVSAAPPLPAAGGSPRPVKTSPVISPRRGVRPPAAGGFVPAPAPVPAPSASDRRREADRRFGGRAAPAAAHATPLVDAEAALMASIRHVEAAADYRRERARHHEAEHARERPPQQRRPASPPAGVPVLDARTEWVGAPMPRRHDMVEEDEDGTPAGRLDLSGEGSGLGSGLSGDEEDADPQAAGGAQTPSEAGTEEEEEVMRAEATLRAMRADADRAAMLSSMVAVSRTTNPGGALADAAAAARRQAAVGGAGRGVAAGAGAAAAAAAGAGFEQDYGECSQEEEDLPEHHLEDGEWVDSDTELPDSASEADPSDEHGRREAGHRREQSVAAERELEYIRHVLERTVGQPRLSKACDRLARLDLAEGFEAARLALGREHEHLLPLVQRLVVGGQARGTA
ncbi:hypothetical protein FNF29_02712 [Cafeteria roenbergensis]|uniref:non-specific serine/threonine protein kinase n=1 Tax=Cafeteria roenbergensis TaxID=33653 RepID=A0A5A8CMV9_CAFRO|nr:hypothetical protein FNF29_02712 [Cafeteria roenbergensis]|eukprot:KAA0154089.1 hypothetical protein FNF29_02712 [Cafeteria roenbergensis]